MQTSVTARRLLQLVFAMSSASIRLTRPRLEQHLAVAPCELNQAIEELTALGLLDPQRLRLTLPGLALAVACSGEAARKRRASSPKAQNKRTNAQRPIALFSLREAPRAVA
jgi:hypothetical protein